MFDFIRTHRRWMQFILLVLILPSFVFVGVQGYTSFVNQEPEVALVAGEPLSRTEFDWALRNQLEQYRQMLGNQFDAALFDTPAMRERLLEQLIDQRVVARAAAEARLSASDEALRRAIMALPALQDNGRYSPERYRDFLLSQGTTDLAFEAQMRRNLALSRVLGLVGTSSYLPLTVAHRLYAGVTEERSVHSRRFAAADYRDTVQVSDADIQGWYTSHQTELTVPAHVRADYLVLDEAAAGQGITVSEADLAAHYEQNKQRYGQPERRRAAHILLAGDDARARAETVARQATERPDDFADLARQYSQDSGTALRGGDLGWLTRGMLVAPVENAIFALQPGEVSAPVESQYGWHVIRLTEMQAERVQPLAEVRDLLEAEIRRQLAAERFAEMASKLTDLVYDQRDSLQPAVDALGLTLRHADGMTRDGLLPADQVAADAASVSPDAARLGDPRVRQALFAPEVQRDRLNSGVIELDPGVLMVLRVAEARPARVPELAAVADTIRSRLVTEGAQAAARAAGEQVLAAAQTGSATPDGLSDAQTVSRREPGALSASVLNAVMRTPATTLPAYTGVAQGEDYVVVQIDAVSAGASSDASAAELTGLRDELSSAWGHAEEDAVLKLLREQYHVQVQPAARSLLEAEAAAL